MEWVGPLQLNSHLVQRGTKRLWVELRKFSNANLCKLSDSSLNIYGVDKMWYIFFIFFLLFLYIHIFSFLSSFNSLQLIHTSTAGLCMVQFYWLPFLLSNPRDKSSPSGPRVGGSCPGGRGLGQIKNIFSLILRSTCHFSRGLHDGYTMAIFKEKRRNLLESVVGEEKPIKIKVCIYNGMF